MPFRLRRIIEPPRFADEQETHMAGLLHVILLVLLGFAVASFIIGLISGVLVTTAVLAVAVLLGGVCLWLTHRGYLNAAGLLLLGGILVIVTFLAVTGQGIYDRSVLAYFLIIIIGSLVLSRRAYIVITCLCIATIGLLVCLQPEGLFNTLQRPPSSPIAFFGTTFVFVICAVIMRLSSDRLDRSLELGRQNQLALQASNQELARQTARLQQSERSNSLLLHRLTDLHEVSIELSRSPDLESFYRQVVQLGRERLGFDRLHLLLYDDGTEIMVGTFGVDREGRLRDIRDMSRKVQKQEIKQLLSGRERVGYWEDVELTDADGVVGYGWNAMAVLWDGDKGIGWLAADNLLRQAPLTDLDLETLSLFSTIVGHLLNLKQNEAAIQAYTSELERSNRELQEFAYVSSHDLQEPLRKIQTFSDRLQRRYEGELDSRGLDYLARMQDAAARMQLLITDLLAYSRVHTHDRHFAPVDLNVLIAGVLSDLETRIEETGAQVSLGAMPTVPGDQTQLRQLFQNLLGNALKFTAPGESPVVDVTVTTPHPVRNGRRYCLIHVQDQGIGFEPKYYERIFGVFQRLHGRGEYEGSGIGLAVCRRIVERHFGRLYATTKPGEGSTFTVELPYNQVLS